MGEHKSEYCRRGLHKMEGENLYVAKNHRQCRLCRNETARRNQRDYRDRKRREKTALQGNGKPDEQLDREAAEWLINHGWTS